MPITMPIVWLAAIVVFVIFEGATLGLTSIWFACGSLVALIIALCGGSILWQIVMFTVGSAALLAFVRPIVAKIKPKQEKMNADRVIGQNGVVTVLINNEKSQGEVRVGGQIWTARSENGQPISVGTNVEVLCIAGVKIIVREVK